MPRDSARVARLRADLDAARLRYMDSWREGNDFDMAEMVRAQVDIERIMRAIRQAERDD